MPGAFDTSPECDYDALRTAEEIQRCGRDLLFWLEGLATSEHPPLPDHSLLRAIHREWFDTTFPADAGRERTEMVINRKGSAVAVEAILPGIENACGNWRWRRENYAPQDGPEFIEFIVSEANALTVRIYDVHPFIDGNTPHMLASPKLRPHARRTGAAWGVDR